MAVYIIRHTKPLIDPDVCYGQADLDICETFYEEVIPIKKFVQKLKGYKCISSPLQRCKKLAIELGFENIQEKDSIKEIHCGDWEHLPWNQLPKKKLDEWAQNLATFKFPNGESYLDLSLRVSEFIKSIDLNNDNIVIVSHGGVIKTLFNIISKVDLSEVMSIKVSYGEVFQIQQDKISKVKLM